jgi:hypothetical protein
MAMASRNGTNGKKPHRRKPAAKKAAPPPAVVMPVLTPQPHGGALFKGGMPGNKGGSGRPPGLTRRLAGRKMPKHVRTLDDIALGKSVRVLAERCPQCGFEPKEKEAAEPIVVKPSDQVSAIRELRKLAELSEVVITSENTRAFVDCIGRAIEEVCDAHLVPIVQDRAVELYKRVRADAVGRSRASS